MTDLYGEHTADRQIGADAVAGEVRQFKRVAHYSNEEVAHRMAKTLAEVKHLRKMFLHDPIPLTSLRIQYEIRVILGSKGIKNLGELLAKSDGELLAIPQIGAKRLAHIRSCIEKHLGKM